MGFSLEFLVFCACACTFVVFLIIRLKTSHTKKLLLPPGPSGLPIIGHLHILHQPLHQTLYKLSQKFGPFFYIEMGGLPTVVISSQEWVKEVLHTHDRQFAGRPQLEACKRLFYNHRTMIMMEHNAVWRHLRKLYTVQILSMRRIEMFENTRHDEMAMSMQLIKGQALLEGAVVDIRKLVFNTVGNMMTRMLFSKRSFDASEAIDGRESKFKELVEQFSVLMGTPVLSDLIPWLSFLDLQGCKKRMDVVAKETDDFLEDILGERIKSKDCTEGSEDSDYLDLLLGLYNEDGKYDKDSIKCILLDILVASTDTTTTTVEWALGELLRNPDCMKKLQEELDTLVGEGALMSFTNKSIKDADLAKLKYLQAIIKESLRFHPPLAIVFRKMCHDLDKSINVGGYQLPKGTRVIFNNWAMGRDPKVWGDNADTFCPDRFLDSHAPDPRGLNFEFIPFGTGRRVCPGMNLAFSMAPLILANLVQVFDWKIPNGTILDLSDAAAFTTPMTKPLVALPTLRERH